jgi:serine/threonine-protein kinase
MAEVTAATLVDDRYRVGDRIGSGGMADVYRAEDTQLGRDVAIKLLHRRFARDSAFVERFRREASSAAGLQHPHVVNVFDRGEHDDTYYIAMEYLGGRTLKQVIADDAPLSQERTIDLGLQILDAAGFAHASGVVHRDFKPHNVIVDENDDVKVTDFGIARAGASEITETGSILGTAQYLSPEQAQGGGTEAASDIYSIGVILYEMLTGRLPFEGESAVAIAVKHLTEEPPRIAEFRPDVHPALEAAVMKALAKDPKHRYRDAGEFAAALQSARAAIAMGDDGQGTAVWAPLTDVPDEEEPKRRRRLLWLLVPLLLVAGLLYLLLLAGPPQVAVPDVVGETLGVAEPELEDAGFVVEKVRQNDQAPLNDVISQDPEPGTEIDEGSTVTLVVSEGPRDVKVPDVLGLGEDEALKKLEKAGLKANTDSQYSLEVAAGLVISTTPEAGEEIPRGSAVDVNVSAGPRPVEVPDVVGESRDGAAATIEAQGLVVAIDEVQSSQPADTVIDQDPPAGTTVDEGSEVALTVSTGPAVEPEPKPAPEPEPEPRPEPETATVPGVVGSSRPDASAALRAAGFGVATSYQTTDDESQDGIVLSQSPAGGTEAKPGATVRIVVGDYQEPEPPPEERGGGRGGGDPGQRSSGRRSP